MPKNVGWLVWSHKLDKAGYKNAGYTMMAKIHKGDRILHNSNSKVMSISVAQTDYFYAKQTPELSKANTSVKSADDDYRIDTTYFGFDQPLITANCQ